jgi:uncharacterized OB-fold protein
MGLVVHSASLARRMAGQIKTDSGENLKLGMSMKPTWGAVRYQAGQPVYGLFFEPLG